MIRLPKIRSKVVSNMAPRNGKSPAHHPSSQLASLIISNLEERYSLKYGMDFGYLLDARDQVMEHSFNLQFDL